MRGFSSLPECLPDRFLRSHLRLSFEALTQRAARILLRRLALPGGRMYNTYRVSHTKQ
jgi:hypothetical protein